MDGLASGIPSHLLKVILIILMRFPNVTSQVIFNIPVGSTGPGKKLDHFVFPKKSFDASHVLPSHPGLAMPPRFGRSPFVDLICVG